MDKERHQEEKLIEQYLNGKLEGESLFAFRSRMDNDSQFKEKVLDYEILYEGFQEVKIQNMKNEVKDWEGEIAKAEKGKIQPRVFRINQWQKIAIAASFLILAFFGFNWYASKFYDNDAIAQNHYSLPNSGVRVIDDKNPDPIISEQNRLFNEGMTAFQSADYKNAINQFQSVNPENENYITAQYLLAHSFYQTNQFEVAVLNFRTVVDSGDSRFSEAAMWFELLAQLRNDKLNDSFYNLLAAISQNPQHVYHTKAIKLEQSLSSGWRKLVRQD